MSEARAKSVGCAETVERNLPAIAELCRRFGVRRLDLFGSAATGRFDPELSDLDFLVEFAETPRGGLSSPYFLLLEALEALFQRKVDLLTIAALKNPYLRRQVLSERQMLFPMP